MGKVSSKKSISVYWLVLIATWVMVVISGGILGAVALWWPKEQQIRPLKIIVYFDQQRTGG